MRPFALLAVVCAVLLAGCRIGGDPQDPSAGDDGAGATADGGAPDAPGEEAAPPPVTPEVSPPAEPTSVLPADDARELAVAAARALYEDAPVVLLASEEDLDAQVRAASVAVRVGAPVLLTPGTPPAEPPDGPVAEELDRVGATTLLTFDDASTRWAGELDGDPTVVRAPTDAAELATVTGVPSVRARPIDPEDATGAVAAIRRDGSLMLEVEAPADGDGQDASADPASGAEAATASAIEDDELSRLEAAPPLESFLALAQPGGTAVAATATARAAGARVVVTEETDPRADDAAITVLAGRPPEGVMAFGDAFGDPDRLRERIEVAATGVELPGGGQVLFPGRRMVALYGHPDTPALGVLGEQPLEDTIRRVEDVAADYEPLSDVPVVPTFEIIATIASSAAGTDGNYSAVTSVDVLRPWVEAAGDAGVYVVLDLQPGRDDFLSQAQHYEELLTEPHVGLALDPEWRLGPDQVHLRQIGSVDAEEVNEVVTWLADLTREHRLPQKLLVLHQFRLSMIADRGEIDTSRDELAVLIHADGNGTPSLKHETWDALTASPPSNVFWGWKNFHDEDYPMMSPEETLEVEPSPLFISYQ